MSTFVHMKSVSCAAGEAFLMFATRTYRALIMNVFAEVSRLQLARSTFSCCLGQSMEG